MFFIGAMFCALGVVLACVLAYWSGRTFQKSVNEVRDVVNKVESSISSMFVKKTYITDDIYVSTINLKRMLEEATNRNMLVSYEALYIPAYESMIFGGALDQQSVVADTEEEAVNQHERLVSEARASLRPINSTFLGIDDVR